MKYFGDYEFTNICDIQPTKDKSGNINLFLPQNNYSKKETSQLHKYGAGPFCHFRIPTELKHKGVYILTVDSLPHYVGKCLNLTLRYNTGYGQISPRNCYKGGQPTNCRINNLILEAILHHKLIELWFHKTEDHSIIEANLIQQLGTRNYWNRTG